MNKLILFSYRSFQTEILIQNFIYCTVYLFLLHHGYVFVLGLIYFSIVQVDFSYCTGYFFYCTGYFYYSTG